MLYIITEGQLVMASRYNSTPKKISFSHLISNEFYGVVLSISIKHIKIKKLICTSKQKTWQISFYCFRSAIATEKNKPAIIIINSSWDISE